MKYILFDSTVIQGSIPAIGMFITRDGVVVHGEGIAETYVGQTFEVISDAMATVGTSMYVAGDAGQLLRVPYRLRRKSRRPRFGTLGSLMGLDHE